MLLKNSRFGPARPISLLTIESMEINSVQTSVVGVRVYKCIFCSKVWFPNKRTIGHDVARCPKCEKYQIPKSITLHDPENFSLAEAKELAAFGPLCDLSKELSYE